MPKAFVTGGTGFLGSHLVDALLDRGYRVACLVRRQSDRRWLARKPIEFVESFIGDTSGVLEESLRESEYCFHVAGIIHAFKKSEYEQVNVEGTRWMVEACMRASPILKRFVYVSSLAAGGPPETEKGLAHEAMNPQPISAYGKSKLAGERLLKEYEKKLSITVIRPPAIYGPRDSQILKVMRLVDRGFFPLAGGRGKRLNLCHVSDVVQGILLAAECDKAVGHTYYVGDARNYTWEEVAEAFEQIVRQKLWKVPVPSALVYLAGFFGELQSLVQRKAVDLNWERAKILTQKNWTVDIRRIKQDLGYEPRIALIPGFEQTLDWYRREGWL